MLGESSVSSKVISSCYWSLVPAYIRFFGLPDVGFQLRSLYFRRFVKQFRFNTVLDAGCGLGLYSFYLAKKFPQAVIESCDIDSKLIKTGILILRELNLNNVKFFELDITSLCEINKYDLIICIDVLEHIKDDQRVIRNFYRALKVGGILYLTTPHKRHVKRVLFSKRVEKGHVRGGYTESEIINLLENNGFKIKKLKNIFGRFGTGCTELYLSMLFISPLLAAICFPLLSMFSSFDMVAKNREGNGLLVIAEKP